MATAPRHLLTPSVTSAWSAGAFVLTEAVSQDERLPLRAAVARRHQPDIRITASGSERGGER